MLTCSVIYIFFYFFREYQHDWQCVSLAITVLNTLVIRWCHNNQLCCCCCLFWRGDIPWLVQDQVPDTEMNLQSGWLTRAVLSLILSIVPTKQSLFDKVWKSKSKTFKYESNKNIYIKSTISKFNETELIFLIKSLEIIIFLSLFCWKLKIFLEFNSI